MEFSCILIIFSWLLHWFFTRCSRYVEVNDTVDILYEKNILNLKDI